MQQAHKSSTTTILTYPTLSKSRTHMNSNTILHTESSDEEAHPPKLLVTRPNVSRFSQTTLSDLELAVKFIKEADYLVISAGAGLSASAGLDYTSEELFARLYPTMHKLGFRYMYQFIGHLPISEELKWGYLLTREQGTIQLGTDKSVQAAPQLG